MYANQPTFVFDVCAIGVFSHQWFPWLCGGFPQNTLMSSFASTISVAGFGKFHRQLCMAGTISLLFFLVF